MITLLMAHFNQSRYLRTALRSVLRQTYGDWQLIVCDDCSNSEEYERIRPWMRDRRIRLLRNEVNLGYIGTLKRMISEASTDVVGIVDADDALSRDAVAEVLKTYANRHIGFTYSDQAICDEWLIPIFRKRSFQFSRTLTAMHYTWQNYYIGHFRTFRKSAYSKTAGYDERFPYAEDMDIAYKLEEVAEGFYIPKTLYRYRQLPNTQSTEPRKFERGKTSHVHALVVAQERRKRSGFPALSQAELVERVKAIRNYRTLFNHPLPHRVFFSCCVRVGRAFGLPDTSVPRLAQTVLQYLARRDGFDEVFWHVSHKLRFAFLAIPGEVCRQLNALLLRIEWDISAEYLDDLAQEVIGRAPDFYFRYPCSRTILPAGMIRFAVFQDPIKRIVSLSRLSGNHMYAPPRPQRFYLENVSLDYLVKIDDLNHFLADNFGLPKGPFKFEEGAQESQQSVERLAPMVRERIRKLVEIDNEFLNENQCRLYQPSSRLSQAPCS